MKLEFTSIAEFQSFIDMFIGGNVTTLNDLKTKLDELSAKVATDAQVKSSASTLLDGLSALLRANANDPAAIQMLADQIDSQVATVDDSNNKLSEAVVRNTPAA